MTELRTGIEVAVARMDDLPEHGGLSVDVAGRLVALFEVDGEPVAYDGRCAHKGGPIGEGYVRDGIVTCPLHWWRYDLQTGRLLSDPAVRLRRVPAEARDGVVFVTVEPEPLAGPPTSIRERLLARARAESAEAGSGAGVGSGPRSWSGGPGERSGAGPTASLAGRAGSTASATERP